MAFTEFREKSDLEEYLHDLDQGSQYDRYAERLWKENVRDLQSAEQTVQVWLGTAASRLSRAPTRLSDLLGQLRGGLVPRLCSESASQCQSSATECEPRVNMQAQSRQRLESLQLVWNKL